MPLLRARAPAAHAAFEVLIRSLKRKWNIRSFISTGRCYYYIFTLKANDLDLRFLIFLFHLVSPSLLLSIAKIRICRLIVQIQCPDCIPHIFR